jgi:hypothetical protein
MFKEIIIPVYTENHTKPINAKMQSYLLLKQAVQSPLGFKGLIFYSVESRKY